MSPHGTSLRVTQRHLSRARRPRKRLAIALAAIASCIVLGERQAKADVYEEAREIIEQLIQDNIAREVIPNAARRSRAVCDFFPATVHAIEMKRYEGLRKVVRKEASDAIGLVVLKEVTAALPGGVQFAETLANTETVSALKGAVDGQKVALEPLPSNVRACGKDYDHENPGQMFEGVESRATLALRKCGPRQADLDTELACAVALLVRDAAGGDDKLLAPSVRRLGSAMTAKLLRMKHPLASPPVGPAIVVKDAELALASATLAAGLALTTSDDALASELCINLGETVPGPAPFSAAPECLADARAGLSLIRGAKADVATFEQALGLIANFTNDATLCSGHSVCKAINELTKGTHSAVKFVEAKNYGAAAGAAFDVARQLNCRDKAAPGCSDDDKHVYKFLQALSVYSVDSLTSGGTTTSSAGFRQAAVDLIEANSGLGIRRTLIYKAQWLYIPEFALRAAYQTPYLDETSPRSFVYPSIDFIRVRIPVSYWARWDHAFVAGQLSAVDALGPFTEIAMRDRSLGTGDSAAGVPFLALLTPRLDIEVGVPDLTRHLVVGGGMAMRLYRAEGAAGAARYCTVVGGGRCDHVTTENFELSLFVKYVP